MTIRLIGETQAGAQAKVDAHKAQLAYHADDYDVPTDGTTDATTAIRAAIAAAAGGSLQFKRRVYVISGSIDLPSDIDIDFGNSTLKVADGTSKGVSPLRILGKQRVTIRNLKIEGNRANRGTGDALNLVDEWSAGSNVAIRTDASLVYSSDILIENVRSYDAYNHGFSNRGVERLRIRSCVAEGYGDDGFDIGAKNLLNTDLQPARMVSVVNCIARNGTQGLTGAGASSGFEVEDGANNVSLVGCLAENGTHGFSIHPHQDSASPHHIAISGCVAKDNDEFGLEVSCEVTDADKVPHNVSVVGFVVEGTPLYGVRLRNAHDVSIQGLTADTAKVQVQSSQRVTVSGSVMNAFVLTSYDQISEDILLATSLVNGTGGVVVGDLGQDLASHSVSIVDNIVRGATAHAIDLGTASTDVTVEGNTLQEFGTDGIRCRAAMPRLSIVRNKIVGVESANDTYGAFVMATQGVVSGNTIFGGGRDGVRVFNSPDTVVNGNTVRNADRHQVSITGSDNCIVNGNRLEGGTQGINIASNSLNGVATDNNISDASTNAIIQTAGSTGWVIYNNHPNGLTNSLLVTGNPEQSSWSRRVRRTVDSSDKTNNTLAEDTQLLWTPGPNEVWWVELMLLINAANSTMDFNCGWAYPTDATILWGPLGVQSSTIAGGWAGDGTAQTPTALLTESSTRNFGTVAGTRGLTLGALVTTGATVDRSVAFRWAQNTTDAGVLKLLKNSLMKLERWV